jgi:hypothetical protein
MAKAVLLGYGSAPARDNPDLTAERRRFESLREVARRGDA